MSTNKESTNNQFTQQNQTKIILTGDRTSGPLHIGHYFGSLINRKKLAAQTYHQVFIMAADVQTLTDNFADPMKIRSNVLETLKDNLTLELPGNCHLFIQSQIPQIAELTVYFSNLVTLNRLLRNPTIKTEIKEKSSLFGSKGESVNYGFVGYPVSQAADILAFRADLVPVGIDQMPVVEVSREIANKFNNIYGDTFNIPETLLSDVPKLLGLDGNSKMSKSLGNAIYLSDDEETTRTKIRSAKTDSIKEIYFDEKSRPEVSSLLKLYSLVSGIELKHVVSEFKTTGNRLFKEALAESINSYFYETRQRRKMISDQDVLDALERSRPFVVQRAKETMQIVRQKLHLL